MGRRWSIALVHGIPAVISTMDELAREICPGVEVFNMLHEGLFLELSRGQVNPSLVRRFCSLIVEAEASGACLVLVTGSTFSPFVDVARKLVSIPVIKIDEAMAEEAVKVGSTIGLVATEEATVRPSSDLILRKAGEQQKQIEIIVATIPEARRFLRLGQVAKHDELILQQVRSLATRVDSIVLAQASMASALAEAKKAASVPVWASPELALQQVRQTLVDAGWQGDASED